MLNLPRVSVEATKAMPAQIADWRVSAYTSQEWFRDRAGARLVIQVCESATAIERLDPIFGSATSGSQLYVAISESLVDKLCFDFQIAPHH